MKKNLFAASLTVLLIFSICFAAVKMPQPKLEGLDITGPDVVSADSQNVWHVMALFADNSEVEVTADADVMVYPDEVAVINLGAIIETLKESDNKEFTIRARYQEFIAEKTVTVSSTCQNR